LTVRQEGDVLVLVRDVGARSTEARYDLAGRPTGNILPNGRTATSTARWDGTTILVSTSQPLDEGTIVSSEERLSLTGSGHLRIVKRVQMPNTEFRSVEVFVRQ
jgi:YD repeat-containing protein